jgi:hypothetical protein
MCSFYAGYRKGVHNNFCLTVFGILDFQESAKKMIKIPEVLKEIDERIQQLK